MTNIYDFKAGSLAGAPVRRSIWQAILLRFRQACFCMWLDARAIKPFE